MSYQMKEHNGFGFVFEFENKNYTIIDLEKDYPNYKIPQDGHAHLSWHYTIIENKNKIIKNEYKIGNILLFNKKKLRKFNASPKIFYNNLIKFRKTTQYEYDKHMLNIGELNDNVKLFIDLTNLFKKNYNNNILVI